MAITPKIIAYDQKVNPFWKLDKICHFSAKKNFFFSRPKIHNGGKAAENWKKMENFLTSEINNRNYWRVE